MYSLASCCCSSYDLSFLRIIEIGDDCMKNFKYKNNVYVLNDDVKVRKSIILFDENGEKRRCYPDEVGKYEAREVYEVVKSYDTIETFETEEEANTFVDEILKLVGDEDVSKSV